MKQNEAEKLARSVRPSEIASRVTLSGDNLRAICDHILSGDMRREIESEAFERVRNAQCPWCAAKQPIQIDHPGLHTVMWPDGQITDVNCYATSIRALIQPGAQKEDQHG